MPDVHDGAHLGGRRRRGFASSSFGAVATAVGEPIKLSAQQVIDAAPFNKPMLLGGVLASETGRMFVNRKR